MDAKKILNYAWYAVPGYGIYKEIKKPKEKRNLHSFAGWSIYCSGAILKAITIPTYIYIGIHTGNWSPFNSAEYFFGKIKNKKEIKIEKKKNNLEKKTCVDYLLI